MTTTIAAAIAARSQYEGPTRSLKLAMRRGGGGWSTARRNAARQLVSAVMIALPQ
jgi:hypothetical protein